MMMLAVDSRLRQDFRALQGRGAYVGVDRRHELSDELETGAEAAILRAWAAAEAEKVVV